MSATTKNQVLDPGNVEEQLKQMGYEEGQLEELTQEEKQQLVEMFSDELNQSSEGVNLKPVRVKINKDIQKFVDPFDEVMETLEGVIVYKHKARGYWPQGGGKVPECSSMDGITGTITESGETRKCAECIFNEWGSAESEDGEKSKGKACKEMRRLYLDMEDYSLPLMLTLPPTSITEFDNYISARMTKGIPDIFKETIIELNKEESHGYTYAVAKFSIGDKVEPKRIFELKDKRKLIKQAAAAEDITQEDYVDVDEEDGVDLNEDLDEDFDDIT